MEVKEKAKLFVLAFVFGLIGGAVAFWIIPENKPQKVYVVENDNVIANTHLAKSTNILEMPDFTGPAANAVQAVVFIKTEYYSGDPMYYFLYGKSSDEPIKGSGSGVIISDDGYVVTNNHVIDKASNINVVLNDKREYTATVIGRDPATDLALLKIEADSLQTLPFGNSDDLQVGEWVLAIGNPFNLTSTVTAGIVSAKARDISILKKQYAIESFIQTDAAVNPGNSGGALINIDGQLVGINSAIASPTGSFAGYSFAIPTSIVQKVVADFIKYGSVQRAYLGFKIADIDENVAERFSLPNLKGVYVSGVTKDGAADLAGIKEGDVILRFENTEVNGVSQLLDLIGRQRPGDKVTLNIRRNDKIEDYIVTLKNEQGGIENVLKEAKGFFGATFEEITKDELKLYGLKNGVKVSDVFPGKFLAAGIKQGMIITKVNNQKVSSTSEVEKILSEATGGIYIEGYDPKTGDNVYFAFGTE
ncbi:MAG: trypsin-like peptidase domain-containing protein [Bacteroidales bacterium]|nr:trypsin-like peptidase domain-containing protein [Bacteroidales bacterium]